MKHIWVASGIPTKHLVKRRQRFLITNVAGASSVPRMDPALPSSLRILCFGASITAGFHHFGLSHHPYAIRLEERLKQSLPSSTSIEIEIDGLSGDSAIDGEYFDRLEPRCKTMEYDWIIVQGGGNDLSFGRTPQAIYAELQKIWRTARAKGWKVLALTVTETSDRSKAGRARYSALNELVRQHKEEGFYVADVERAIPWPAEEQEQRRIWDDGLHFKKVGYHMMGDAIAQRLLDIIRGNMPTARI